MKTYAIGAHELTTRHVLVGDSLCPTRYNTGDAVRASLQSPVRRLRCKVGDPTRISAGMVHHPRYETVTTGSPIVKDRHAGSGSGRRGAEQTTGHRVHVLDGMQHPPAGDAPRRQLAGVAARPLADQRLGDPAPVEPGQPQRGQLPVEQRVPGQAWASVGRGPAYVTASPSGPRSSASTAAAAHSAHARLGG